MRNQYDVVIIGGGPGGVTTALSCRGIYPDKNVLLIRREEKPMIPCGIPYTLNTLNSVEENILPDAPLINKKVDILVDTVTEVGDHILKVEGGDEIKWSKLVIATGSSPVILPIEGKDLGNVFTVPKNAEKIKEIKGAIENANDIVVIGGGFIGVEVTDELLKKGKSVTLIEKESYLVSASMDEEFGEEIKNTLVERGANVICNATVKALKGENKVNSVLLETGKEIKADVVIMAAGYRPNLKIAEMLNIEYHPTYGIITDDFQRTSKTDIFAVGDVAAKRHFLSGKYSLLMLASTAMSQGRIVGSNLFDIKAIKGVGGFLGTFSTKIGNTAFAATGITEKQAKQIGIEYVVGYNEAIDRHPGKLPGAHKQKMKLIFSKYGHVLIGAQVSGGDSIGEMINLLTLMIQNRMTDAYIKTTQIGTHPLLTASPIAYPLINATVDAILKRHEG